MAQFKAAISDLDGVVVNTVPLHFKAWQRMFNEYGKEFTFDDYKAKVDGIPRVDGARAVLTDLSDDEIKTACDKKQGYFIEMLKTEGVDQYDSTLKLLKELKQNNIKIAIISSSKNLPYILEKISRPELYDVYISGHDITKGKPDPQVFNMAAKKLGVAPEDSVVFEDAVLGVEAAKNANMKCVGVDRYNHPERLTKADIVVSDLSEVNYEKLIKLF